jgi:hypothetical protein
MSDYASYTSMLPTLPTGMIQNDGNMSSTLVVKHTKLLLLPYAKPFHPRLVQRVGTPVLRAV